MHVIKSRFLVRGEVWFEHEPEPIAVDWLFYRQRSRPVPGARWSYFYTRLIELQQDPKELLGRMNKATAYQIRRARDKDGTRCECLSPLSRDTLDRFVEIYRRFAAIKGVAPVDRPLLAQLAEDGFLEMSCAKTADGTPVAYHAYYRDSGRSCLLYTVSLYQTLSESAARNAVGRANRYLFWCDILRHREQGLKLFDFGGWYPGSTDLERLDINRFKEGFGGRVVQEYNCERILSLRGRVVLAGAALLNGARNVVAKLQRPPTRGQQPEIPGGLDESAAPASPAVEVSGSELAK